MRSKRTPSYLFKTPQDIFYFRIRIPSSIRIKYNTPKVEIRKSLNTHDISVAMKRARFLWVTMEETDYTMKNIESVVQEDNEGRKLLKQFLALEIRYNSHSYLRDIEDETVFDAFIGKLSVTGRELLNKQLDKWDKLKQNEKDVVLDEIRQEVGSSFICSQESHESIVLPEKMGLSTELVSKKIAEFLEYYQERKAMTGKSAPINTIKEYEGIYEEFLQIIGLNFKCCDLNKKVIKNYGKALWNVPANYRKKRKYIDLDINEIVKMKVPVEEKRSPGTINKHLMRVKQFLVWAGKEDFIVSGLDGFLEALPDSVAANEKRDAFSADELHLLFNNDIYEKYNNKPPSRYWLPLLALFTGARGEELAQLHKEDIEKNEELGIYFIRIKENDLLKQGLKNKSASRVVPIHSQLKMLGFLDYVKSIKRDSMIFPELYSENGDCYKRFGNNFNRKSKSGWKWKCGVTGDKTSFHSFRHNVVDFLAKSKADERVVCSLVGHHYKGSGLVANYIKPHELKDLQKAINLLVFPSIDWTKIRKWKR